MKHYRGPMLFMILVAIASIAAADHGSANRVATVSVGKRFDPDEWGATVDPVMMPLNLKRLSGRDQSRAIGGPEMSWYGALGYVAGNPSLYYEGPGGLSVLIFADRSLNCIRISVTDLTEPPDKRVIPTISAIGSAIAGRYGTAMKHYSDLQCNHAL
jgi:hypothetical protein